MPRSRVRPAFLNKHEIRELATRLNTTPHVVATVLQVAGHVLRERYRKRGWEPKKREKPPKGFRGQQPPGSGRTDIGAVLDALDRPTPHPDGPFTQPPDVPAIPEYDEKGIRP